MLTAETLTPKTRVARRPTILHTRLANQEAVLLDLDARRYFRLNVTGAEVWDFLQEETTVGAVIQMLAGRYAVGGEQIAEPVQGLLAELLAERLITVQE
jgi:hypothetical protein